MISYGFKLFASAIFVLAGIVPPITAECNESPITTASGTHAPKDFCKGDLIFNENFKTFDKNLWEHEISLFGGHNGEFQWYTNDPANLYIKNEKLCITPTLTYKYLPCRCPDDLYQYKLNLTAEYPYVCHISDEQGCYMEGSGDEIINPIRSGKVKTPNSFKFKYGSLEVKAKIPLGDWLWPAIWLMPADSVYGGWPKSGEIDLMESRGNDLIMAGNTNIGVEQVGMALHYGDQPQSSTSSYNRVPGFDTDFHLYKLEWTPTHLRFQVDDFAPWYQYGPFGGNYTGSPNQLAPFDQEFYFILNVAVGGTNYYFPEDGIYYPNGKPWANWEGRRISQTKFWRSDHWKSYEQNPEQSSMQIDYIKVWAL